MAWADIGAVDELTQLDRGLRYLLRDSGAAPTAALIDFVNTHDVTTGKLFVYDTDTAMLPGKITPDDTPCLIVAPGALPLRLWNTNQARLEATTAIAGMIVGRNSEALNRFLSLTLRALFQRRGCVPDVLAANPETTNLDFVQGLRVGSTIQRTPGGPLSREQRSALDVDDAESLGYTWFGFRVLVTAKIQARYLGG